MGARLADGPTHGRVQASGSRALAGLCLAFLALACAAPDERAQVVRPTTDFDLNYLNVPTAWTITRGSGTDVWILGPEGEDCRPWRDLLLSIAPAATARCVPAGSPLDAPEGPARPDVVLLMPSPGTVDVGWVTELARRFVGETLVVAPAWSGPMRRDDDIEARRSVIRSLQAGGALVVGSHGASYELGDASHWLGMGVRLFALNREARGEAYYRYDRLVEYDLRRPAVLAAGVAALLRAAEPGLSPRQVRDALVARGRKVVWARHPSLAHDDWLTPLLPDDPQVERLGLPTDSILEATTLDAAMALGLDAPDSAAWCLKTLNLRAAHDVATGRGRTIAILDHEFDEHAADLRDRWVSPGSVHPGVPVWGPSTGHGIWMARYAAQVAPGARIMPVRIWAPDGGWAAPDRAQSLIDGIRYAVSHGADVVSLSQSSIPEDWIPRFDAAAQDATEHGVVVVYIHYYGPRKDVVVPHPIEYDRTRPGPEYVYVVGTGFFSDEMWPNTWGVSAGAPIVAGVVAMIKEVAPDLRPTTIRDVLLRAGTPVGEGRSTLDAVKALELAARGGGVR